MKLPSINYYRQIQDGGIQDGWMGLKKSTICNSFDKSSMATSKMAVSKMASFCNVLSCTHAPLCPHSYIRPLYWKETELILYSPLGSHFESIAQVVGDLQTFDNTMCLKLVYIRRGPRKIILSELICLSQYGYQFFTIAYS